MVIRSFDGEYSGAALQSFIRGLKQSPQIITTILKKHGISKIDPNSWYDIKTAQSIYATVGKMIGNYSLSSVGIEIIDTAPFPPQINDVATALQSIQNAYEMSARGSNLGSINCDIKGSRRAIMTFTTPFPCALDKGIIQGCAKRFGSTAIIQHAPGCREEGHAACVYTIEWIPLKK